MNPVDWVIGAVVIVIGAWEECSFECLKVIAWSDTLLSSPAKSKIL